MFSAIRIRLVLWNAVVLVVILLGVTSAVLFDLRILMLNSLDTQIQRAMQPIIHRIQSDGGRWLRPKNPATESQGPRPSPVNQPSLGILVWNQSGQLVSPTPRYLSQTDMKRLGQIALRHQRPMTLALEGQKLRVATVPIPLPSGVSNKPSTATQTFYVEGIRNANDVMTAIRQIKWLVIVSSGIGVLLAAFIGVLLAERALVPIRKAWERQVKFVADASHELRSPLAAITANAEMLMQEKQNTGTNTQIGEEPEIVSQKQLEADVAYAIFSEARRLRRLTSQLLALARSDSHTAVLQKHSVSVTDLTKQVVRQFEPMCEVAGITLTLDVEEQLTATVDEDKIRELLFILLDNARKFTASDTGRNSAHSAQIRVHIQRTGRFAEWIVEDEGIGIALAHLNHIFDRFYQVDRSRSSHEGAGLGLSIAKWIVEAHGGQIHVQSQLGKGTVFRIQIPLT